MSRPRRGTNTLWLFWHRLRGHSATWWSSGWRLYRGKSTRLPRGVVCHTCDSERLAPR